MKELMLYAWHKFKFKFKFKIIFYLKGTRVFLTIVHDNTGFYIVYLIIHINTTVAKIIYFTYPQSYSTFRFDIMLHRYNTVLHWLARPATRRQQGRIEIQIYTVRIFHMLRDIEKNSQPEKKKKQKLKPRNHIE
jgi:hypothetical protein